MHTTSVVAIALTTAVCWTISCSLTQKGFMRWPSPSLWPSDYASFGVTSYPKQADTAAPHFCCLNWFDFIYLIHWAHNLLYCQRLFGFWTLLINTESVSVFGILVYRYKACCHLRVWSFCIRIETMHIIQFNVGRRDQKYARYLKMYRGLTQMWNTQISLVSTFQSTIRYVCMNICMFIVIRETVQMPQQKRRVCL